MKKFIANYKGPNGDYSVYIDAIDMDEAELLIDCINENGLVYAGEIKATIRLGVPKWTYAVAFGMGLLIGFTI